MLNPNGRKLNQNGPKVVEAPEGPEAQADDVNPEVEPTEMDPIDMLIADFGSEVPDRSVINGWKNLHRDVHAYVPLGAEEFYLFRPLKRIEFRKLRNEMDEMKRGSAGQDPAMMNDMFHERIVGMCILHPSNMLSPNVLNTAPAGLFETLANLVMNKSHFVDAGQALNDCMRL